MPREIARCMGNFSPKQPKVIKPECVDCKRRTEPAQINQIWMSPWELQQKCPFKIK